ncbi:NAD(P)-dependent alcohol dehydrogenase [Acholeplasma manati]|uniref:NAD(P)-dependent alcohol dehydrogenase n=1 Tax=Paracholeplasma manati TaxID=591373 RepID=A0ABT2Y7D1_9MOLU|nr:NAD(P)-dependent alcohol dehydrogenase [Paracholeplasma manati]MCV2232646.1 NAD(P)-dependent alcohol dehydrogenase [Paracholeplasma manati]
MHTVVNRHYHQLNNIHIEERTLNDLKDNDVLVKVHGAALNKADLLLAMGKPFMIKLMYGLKQPKKIYPGSDFAGEVVSVGSKVTHFKPGDAVFGDLSGAGFGAFAEYLIAPESKIWFMPKGYSYLEAAAMPMAFGTAMTAIQKISDIKDKKVLVYGGSGGVGRFLVQALIYFGAKVTVVSSSKHFDDLKQLGVFDLLDYTKPDFLLPQNAYDVIFAVNGYQPLKSYAKALVRGGKCIVIGGSGKQIFGAMALGPFYGLFKHKRFSSVIASTGHETLQSITNLANQTKIDVQISQIYTLSQVNLAYKDFYEHKYTGKYLIDVQK